MKKVKKNVKEVVVKGKETPGLADNFVKNWDKRPHLPWDFQTVDRLAAKQRRDYKSWSFSMPNISQERWDSIFGKR